MPLLNSLKLPAIVDEVWRSKWFGWVLVAVLVFLWLYWRHDLPTQGKAVAALAVGAAMMSLRTEASGVEKTAWMLMLFAFLYVELSAIDRDKQDNDRATKQARTEERTSFEKVLNQERADNRTILEQEKRSLTAVLTQSQNQFTATIRTLVASQHEEHNQFQGILNKQQELFDHEQQLAESLDGTLLPSNEPTPRNSCGDVPSGGAILMLGDDTQHNAALVTRFPHTVLEFVHDKVKIPMLSLDRSPSGTLTVLLDIRSGDGKIIARMDKEGFVVNRNNFLEVKRNKSSLKIIDEYGNEVLKVRYLNPSAISVSGPHIGLPRGFSFICASNSGEDGADYAVD